jgi:hypothetical protein
MNNSYNQALLKDTSLQLIEEESLNIIIDKDLEHIDIQLYVVHVTENGIFVIPEGLNQICFHDLKEIDWLTIFDINLREYLLTNHKQKYKNLMKKHKEIKVSETAKNF